MKRREMPNTTVNPSYFIIRKDFTKLEMADGIKILTVQESYSF